VVPQRGYLPSSPRTGRPQVVAATAAESPWQFSARCIDFPSAVFFPEEKEPRERRRAEVAAKQICSACPVISQCREHALRTPENHGVWGAMTSAERNSYYARRRVG
jgi:WhiB family redox-sensing transcriptional regulator